MHSNKYLSFLYPGMKIKRWCFFILLFLSVASFGFNLILNYNSIFYFKNLLFKQIYCLLGTNAYILVKALGLYLIIVGAIGVYWAATHMLYTIITIFDPYRGDYSLIDVIFNKHKLSLGPKIVTIGGGTGLSVLLRGLKTVSSNITAVVTVSDTGGSSGKLRKELGIIPPGDLRNCLVALSDSEPLFEKLLQYRFKDESNLKGHNLGNLLLAALVKELGDVELAMNAASKIFKLYGKVLPSTKSIIKLVAKTKDGLYIEGEENISKARKKIDQLYLKPENIKPLDKVVDAILEANIIIIGPGSLYTSIIPNLLIEGIRQAITRSKAPKIYICNIMTQYGETEKYTVSDHLNAIIKHVGKIIDYAIINDDFIADNMLHIYATKHTFPVIVDIAEIEKTNINYILADLVNQTNYVRHDINKLLSILIKLMKKLYIKNK